MKFQQLVCALAQAMDIQHRERQRQAPRNRHRLHPARKA